MSRAKLYILGVFFLVIAAPLLLLLLLSSTPAIEIGQPPSVIGTATPVNVHVTDTHGIRRFTAVLEQSGQKFPLSETTKPPHRFLFWRQREAPVYLTFTAGTKTAPGAKDGKANLILQATSNDLRGATATLTREVTVVTIPPSLAVDSSQHYINQGGSELVTFAVGGYATASGVKLGDFRFRSFQMPGKQQRLSLFAFPWDLPASTVPVVFATNSADEVTRQFWYRVFPKRFRRRDLVIDDPFLERIVNQIEPGGSGDLLSRFLKINGEMRKQNNAVLAGLRAKTAEKFLWSGPFLQLANSKVESQFADVRSYIYKGKKVDQQVHLGFDLSRVKNTPIPAANDGLIVFAEKLGIYGNCVVIDHGYGLQSIYGHLSQIQVKPGDAVKKSQTIGLSGATGLAGGDHLHFSMQVDGVQVNPVEWWDEHWIRDRIWSKVPPGS
ncbi:MAG: M23 family metallopeptidase [Bryobacteraceae bacterium]